LTKTNSEVKREDAAKFEEEKKEHAEEISLSKLNRDVETDDDICESDEDHKDHEEVLAEYKHALKDMNSKKRRVIDALDKRIGENLIMKKVFIEFALEKDDLLQQFQLSLEDAHAKGSTKFVVYFVGHGNREKGGWVTFLPTVDGAASVKSEDKLVTIGELLDLVNKSSFGEALEITSESCHSGEMCH